MTNRRGLAAILVPLSVFVATIAASGQAGVPPPPPPPPSGPPAQNLPVLTGTAAISGVVIDGVTNQPVYGAVVQVQLGGGARATPAGPTRVLTDAQGRFVFTRLPAGLFTLSTTKLGYLNGYYGQSQSGAGSAVSAARPLRLAEGQYFAEARIVMWRPSAITGTITDEAGEPVVRTWVRVFTRIMVAGRPQLAAGSMARTDDRGRYRIASLASGRYVVMVPSVQASIPGETTLAEASGLTADDLKAAETTGRAPTLRDLNGITVDRSARLILSDFITPPPSTASGWAYPPTFFPAARAIAEATVIDLRDGADRSGIDIQLSPVRTVRVSGIVDGPPGVASALTVRLLAAGSESLGLGAETATALVAADGVFTFLNVPSGSYTIVASRASMEYQYRTSVQSLYSLPQPPGYAGTTSGSGVVTSGAPGTQYAFRRSKGDALYAARMPIVVGDQSLTGVTVTLRRSVAISGTVTYADGPPDLVIRVGLPILAEPANGDTSLGLPTNQFGGREDPTRFRVEGLLAGEYILRPLPAGSVLSIMWQGRDYTDKPFDATPGRDIEGVSMTFTTLTTRLAGAVRDAKGNTASGGAVIAFPVDRSMWSNYGLNPARIASARVSTDGTYGFSSLRAGEYFIIAVDESMIGDWQDPKFLEAASVLASRVTLAWGDKKSQDVAISPVRIAR